MSRFQLDAPSADVLHLVGVCGAGMKGLAELLADAGRRVHGSDQQPNPHRRALPLATPLQIGTDANLRDDVTVVVHSPAVPESDPVLTSARERGLSVYSLTKFLAGLVRSRPSICIAGTHGKSTTAAMTAWATNAPALFGANLGGSGTHAQRSGWVRPPHTDGDAIDRLIVEACEFRSGLLQYQPEVVVLLGLEWDHPDCFSSAEDVRDCFQRWIDELPAETVFFVDDDAALNRELRFRPEHQVQRVGRTGADGQVDAKRAPHGFTGTVTSTSGEQIEFRLDDAAEHDVQNAAFAAVVARHSGVDPETIAWRLSEWPGLERRFQRITAPDADPIGFDDYAHHPTAIRSVLASLRKRYPSRRLVVAFEPHQLCRTEALFDDFAESLSAADVLFLRPAFAARETESDAHTDIVRRLAVCIADRWSDGRSVLVCDSLDHLRACLDDTVAPGDVWITFGAGPIGRLHANPPPLPHPSAPPDEPG